ncbi:VOC family protein [Candidatus Woesearchaeota archaeon]|nr:VOC family protein [Candidatus Woesearchaeota archaeon]
MKFNKLIPELGTLNFEKSLQFYTEIIGFKIEYKRGDKEKEHKFALISMQESQLMIDEITNPKSKTDKFITGKLQYPLGRGINFQIEVKNITPILTRLKKNKYPLQSEVKDNWYRQDNKLLGNKEFMVMDPDGYLLRFAQNLKSKKIN